MRERRYFWVLSFPSILIPHSLPLADGKETASSHSLVVQWFLELWLYVPRPSVLSPAIQVLGCPSIALLPRRLVRPQQWTCALSLGVVVSLALSLPWGTERGRGRRGISSFPDFRVRPSAVKSFMACCPSDVASNKCSIDGKNKWFLVGKRYDQDRWPKRPRPRCRKTLAPTKWGPRRGVVRMTIFKHT